MGQLRDYRQTWDSLQRYIIMFLPSNGHMDTGYTLQEKIAVYTSQWEHGWE